jgi:hypothetical protein
VCFTHQRHLVGRPECVQTRDRQLGDPDHPDEYELFRHSRFLIQSTLKPMACRDEMQDIERFGTVVVPIVRHVLAKS